MAPLLVVVTEASADRLAADVVHHLAPRSILAIGGADLHSAGARLLADLRHFTAMGTVEVLSRAPRLLEALVALYDEISCGPLAAALLVDGPDANLPIAAWLRRRGVPVVYYVAPQVWAWRASRMRALRERVRRLAVILPFEEAPLRAAGVDAHFVGHPLLDRATPSRAEARRALGIRADGLVVTVAPGSRPAEVDRHLGVCLEAARMLGPVEVLVPAASSLPSAAFTQAGSARIVPGPASVALAAADVALVCSGTATLESVLAGTPPVIVYRTSHWTFLAARALVRTRHVGLPNLVLDRGAFPELLQDEIRPVALARAAEKLLTRVPTEAMQETRARLGKPGASARVAAFVRELAA